MAINKRSIPFINCYMSWCTSKLKSFTYDNYSEFNEYLDKEYDLLWNSYDDISFRDPATETAFLLKWS